MTFMSSSDELAKMQVNGALEALAARHASGVLQVDGDPAGTVYLDQGQITCARAAWVPDIGARLLGTLRSSDDSLDLLTGADEPDRDIGTFLVQRNYLTIQELATLLRSVVVDTLIALTALADEDAFISDIRFAPAGAHWAAAFSCLEVDSVLAEAARRAGRMARVRLSRTTPVRLHDLSRRPSAVLTRSQWTLACAIDGAASVQDLAWRCGQAIYDATENLGHLVDAGLCQAETTEALISPVEPQAPPASPLAQWFDPVPRPPSLFPAAPRPRTPPRPRRCRPRPSSRQSSALRAPTAPLHPTCCAESWTASGEPPSPARRSPSVR
jgi:hypothetical protein